MTEVMPTRVVIAEDERFMRALLATFLRGAGMDVVAEVSTPAALLQAVRSTPVDVAIIDIRFPSVRDTDGLQAAREIRRVRPEIGILMLSKYLDTRSFNELAKAGQVRLGYGLKETVDPATFPELVRDIAAGGYRVDPVVVAALMGKPQVRNKLNVLTSQELKVLALIAEGLPNERIMERLAITDKTLGAHIGRIFSKLGLGAVDTDHQRRVRAVLIYLESFGLLIAHGDPRQAGS